MDERVILEEMRAVLAATKIGQTPAGWSEGKRSDQLTLALPLDVHAPVLSTAHLRFRAERRHVGRNVSATLIITLAGRDLHAWRLDWRPDHPHDNKVGPWNLRGLTVEGTGIHEFEPNAWLGLEAMQAGNLPVCRPVEHDPHDFDAMVRLVCDSLQIALTEPIYSPLWSPRLL